MTLLRGLVAFPITPMDAHGHVDTAARRVPTIGKTMTRGPRTRFSRRFLIAILLCLQAGAGTVLAQDAASGAHSKPEDGFGTSIMEGAQGNFGKLGIGAGYMGGGSYLDEAGIRRAGLHADLSITIDDDRSAFRQPSVHEGQTLEVNGYRIRIDRILLDGNRGFVVLRVWMPAGG